MTKQEKLSNLLFIFWAGGAALLSYALVYALRKPFTAATFDGLEFMGMDYKTATSIVQIAGYVLSKFLGIKLISELRREHRFRFNGFVGRLHGKGLPLDRFAPVVALVTCIVAADKRRGKQQNR